MDLVRDVCDAWQSSVDAFAKLGNRGFECLRDAKNADDCRVALTTLNSADVRSVEVGVLSQIFLGEVANLPFFPNFLPEFS